jgi:uncharacterized alkaline shock family protein YloU
MANIGIKSADGRSLIGIDYDAVAAIAVRASLEVDGVVALEGGFASGLAVAFGKEGSSSGVRLSFDGTGIYFQLSVVARYGVRIPDLAWNLQDHVKKTVERCVGLTVSKVDVLVVGVREGDGN